MASEMAQQVQELTAKPDGLSWFPRTHMVERENQVHKLSPDLHMQVPLSRSPKQKNVQNIQSSWVIILWSEY